MATATYDRDPRLVVDELGSPLGEGLLDSLRVRGVGLLFLAALLSFFAFLLGGPDLLALIDVDDGGLVLLGRDHDRGDELLLFFLSLIDTVDVNRTEIEKDRVGLGD